jgi:hypothetical protein
LQKKIPCTSLKKHIYIYNFPGLCIKFRGKNKISTDPWVVEHKELRAMAADLAK